MVPLYQRFADTAARTPDALAIQAGGQTLTHRQFRALADAQADRWLAEGLGAGSFIGCRHQRVHQLSNVFERSPLVSGQRCKVLIERRGFDLRLCNHQHVSRGSAFIAIPCARQA